VADDHAGLRAALREVVAEAAYQRCYVHFLRNALDYVPRRVDDDCLQELRWLYDRRDLPRVLEPALPGARAVEAPGGKVEAFYFAYGQDDTIIIADYPDAASATAVSLVGNSTGVVFSRPALAHALSRLRECGKEAYSRISSLCQIPVPPASRSSAISS
jgi:hypothetical protein